MKRLFLLLIFAKACCPLLLAQSTMRPELSGEYECTVITLDDHASYKIRDTWFFDVRRTAQPSDQDWNIHYDILKTYPFGLFRTEKANYNPTFLVDKKGKQRTPYYPDKLGRLCSYVTFKAYGSFTPLPPGVTLKYFYPLTYEDPTYFRVQKDGKVGLLDMNLAETVPIQVKEAGPVTRYGVVVGAQGKYGVIKRK